MIRITRLPGLLLLNASSVRGGPLGGMNH
ncbi:leu operon leader peptide [Erwinia psidii]|uniref:leu operon leader peptide n=1 Tax=Erwinia psidii TaxID=69224 RepID=A0A3N6S236_9GAMM|nr:leu operon leader peptide [Erwinia psidii]MCX8960602.1 leu operon leader peptide [Erwinia psidii]MCX8964153.1 leu operon leader peptide [Erwinia psidii]RQM39634.1 leu operon leader peptide [Erwinia psidii]